MATEKREGTPQATASSTYPTAEPTVGETIRQAEATLSRAEELLGAATPTEDELSEAEWQLTLSKWNLGRNDALERQWPRQVAIVAASIAVVTYLIYRAGWTMNLATTWSTVFSVFLLLAELYAGISLGLYFFQVWRLVDPPIRRPPADRTVDVFIATYNEDVSLLRGTLTACLEMDYPHATYVLDDGNRPEVRRLAESLGCRYITRSDRAHAKAGNLNNALRQTDGEFVVVFDADHMPYRHYITRLLGYFDDPRVAFVQTPHTTYNLDNFMGRWKSKMKTYWEDIRIFFEAVQLGKNLFNVACFCGSAAIFRRKAIEEVGLFATETITEDLHTGMRINAAGWKSLAVSEEMVVGLAPDDATTFASQRLRWGEGNLSVLAYDNPLTMKGLTLAARIHYLASISCWTMGPARTILYLTPLVMLLTGVAPVADLSLRYFMIVGCYLAMVWGAVKIVSNGCGQLIGIEMAMMASFHLQLQSLWRALFRRHRQVFVVTRKSRILAGRWAGVLHMWPQMTLVVLSIVAIAWASSRVLFGLSADYFGLVVGSGLALYHSWLALSVLDRAASSRNVSTQWQHPLCLNVDYSVAGDDTPGVSIEFNENVCHILTWKPVETDWPLRVIFHSPVGDTVGHGRVASVLPLGGKEPFAYLSNIVFDHADPSLREQEGDQIRDVIMRYVLPVVTMTHRTVHQGQRELPEELSGEGDFPIPITIQPNRPNLALQRSIALCVTKRDFVAPLSVSCPIGSEVQVMLDTPIGQIVANATVQDVETMHIGATIVHQHEFAWRDSKAIKRILRRKGRWTSTLGKTIATMRNHHQAKGRLAWTFVTGSVIALATVLLFHELYYGDIQLVKMTHDTSGVADRTKAAATMERIADSPTTSASRLLRLYRAADAVGDDALAADAASQLAQQVPTERAEWRLTAARHLVRAGKSAKADAAFDRIVAEPLPPNLSTDETANIYVEAARAAITARDLPKAVDRFLRASSLRAADPDQAEELLGVLIAAKETHLAIQVLQQLERTDRVLRHIIDVYEMAGQPEKAVPELEELHRRHPDDAAVVVRLAELAVVRRDFVAGLKYYQLLHKLEPDNKTATDKLAETMLLLAREDVAAKRYDHARQLFQESFQLQPPTDALKREYGGFLAATGHFDQAIAMLEPLKDAASKQQLAAVYEMQGHPAKSLEILLPLEKTPGSNEAMAKNVVRLLLATGAYDEAAERLLPLLKKHPNDPQFQRAFVEAAAASTQTTDAMRQTMNDVFRSYRETDFHSLDAAGFERLGDALRRLGMFTEANAVLDHAVAEYPKSRRLRFYLAETLGNLGRYDDAEKQYEILLKTRPTAR
jgi:cellulose synthase/poly-beta-1,6-N-acetylglucosamine synthase-like glycosyltransferase/tetratricopeptide (TPR) repeat protein